MRTKRSGFFPLAIALLGLALPSRGDAVPVLQELAFNVNGTTYANTTAVVGLDASAFDTATGLGTLVMTFDTGAPGTYNFDAYFDHDLHDPFFDEYGAVVGAPAAGVSWQIDEPGFGDANRVGTIYTNTTTNLLDDTNHVPGTLSNFFLLCGGNGGASPDANCNNDVAMALGFNFVLAAGDTAVVTLTASQTPPPSGGFFLAQTAPADGSPAQSVYLTGRLAVAPVPEPASALLFGVGFAVTLGALRRMPPARSLSRSRS